MNINHNVPPVCQAKASNQPPPTPSQRRRLQQGDLALWAERWLGERVVQGALRSEESPAEAAEREAAASGGSGVSAELLTRHFGASPDELRCMREGGSAALERRLACFRGEGKQAGLCSRLLRRELARCEGAAEAEVSRPA